MAAAEYFSSAPMTGQQQQHSSPYEMPSAHQRPPTSNPTGNSYSSNNNNGNTPIPQIQAHPPPQYTSPAQANNPGGHYQQSPSPNHQSPNLRPYGASQPMQINQSRPQNQGYPQYASAGHTPPMHYNTPPYGSTPPTGQHLTPYMRPHANSYPSQLSLDSGFSSDPERQRRKHRNYRRHRDENGSSRDMENDKSTRPRSRSNKADAFLGAAGGGLIGDLIFPGLGTIGGAAIGWLGGREYARERKGREDKRHDAQVDWERKFRPSQYGHHKSRSGSRDRDRGRDYDSRGSSRIGERTGSHDSRRSHH